MLPETPHQFFACCWALCFQRTSDTATCGDAPISFSPARNERNHDSVSVQPGPSLPVTLFSSGDDGWAYARSVQHLLATGKYQLDTWSAANMPVQIYLAAALCAVFGYSLTLLRFTTLAFLVAGVASFYALLREISYTPSQASILSLGLVASPLVLMLGFTFMSDVQFLGWFLLALWQYVRGIRACKAWQARCWAQWQPGARLERGSLASQSLAVYCFRGLRRREKAAHPCD